MCSNELRHERSRPSNNVRKKSALKLRRCQSKETTLMNWKGCNPAKDGPVYRRKATMRTILPNSACRLSSASIALITKIMLYQCSNVLTEFNAITGQTCSVFRLPREVRGNETTKAQTELWCPQQCNRKKTINRTSSSSHVGCGFNTAQPFTAPSNDTHRRARRHLQRLPSKVDALLSINLSCVVFKLFV